MEVEGRVCVVSVSGVIGAGKSTLLKRLQRTGALQTALGNEALVRIVREPVKEWRECGWLSAFYANPSLNAAAFQLLAVDSRIRAMKLAIEDARRTRVDPQQTIVLLSERCKYDDRLFWEQQRADGCITAAPDLYNEMYVRTWQRWSESVPETSLIFFLHTSDIQQTMRRMQVRQRAEEMSASSSSEDAAGIEEVGGVTIDYQKQLLARHFEWFDEPRAHPMGAPDPCGIPCIHINGDVPFHECDGTLDAVAALMATHIQTHVLK